MLIIYFGLLFLLEDVNFPEVHYLIMGFLLILVAICDHVLTYKALKNGAKEKNPIANLMFNFIGIKKTSFLILIGFIIFIYFLFKDLPVYAQLSLILSYSIVPINNFIVWRKKIKMKLHKKQELFQ